MVDVKKTYEQASEQLKNYFDGFRIPWIKYLSNELLCAGLLKPRCVSCRCALTFRFHVTYRNQNCLFPFIEFLFEVYRYRLMNHKLTVSHSLSGNEFSIAIFKILSKQESIWLCLTDSFNFVLQISINYFLYIIKHKNTTENIRQQRWVCKRWWIDHMTKISQFNWSKDSVWASFESLHKF